MIEGIFQVLMSKPAKYPLIFPLILLNIVSQEIKICDNNKYFFQVCSI